MSTLSTMLLTLPLLVALGSPAALSAPPKEKWIKIGHACEVRGDVGQTFPGGKLVTFRVSRTLLPLKGAGKACWALIQSAVFSAMDRYQCKGANKTGASIGGKGMFYEVWQFGNIKQSRKYKTKQSISVHSGTCSGFAIKPQKLYTM